MIQGQLPKATCLIAILQATALTGVILFTDLIKDQLLYLLRKLSIIGEFGVHGLCCAALRLGSDQAAQVCVDKHYVGLPSM